MDVLGHSLKVPDLWQQKAVKCLQQGKDVVVNAPTGAGKTYIFELFVQRGLRRQAVYTVPTRALANDKLYEWRSRGWNVGIATGDIAEKLDAPVIVATLETQKSKFLRGQGPGLLVIDEYQMLADDHRGINYELAIALAPPGTQLLLLSGSVSNPGRIVQWLASIGREAELINHHERPVPLEEIQSEALTHSLPATIRGRWPRIIASALASEMGPVLVFAPQRRVAEELAHKLSAALPTPEWLELSSEQRQLAGDPLAKMLRNRIAYHHSGLSYPQRAGLIEPLAKAGQLRVIVATTGLAAGINFSMRSVIVTDREYQHSGKSQMVRADELLQMFGRAGRRGLDDKGYILVAPGGPRLSEARPANIRRSTRIDWPSFIAVMHQAALDGDSPVHAADNLAERLFTEQRVALGLRRLQTNGNASPAPAQSEEQIVSKNQKKLKEMLNSQGEWERQKPKIRSRLGDSFVYLDGNWKPALQTPKTLEGVEAGTLCKLSNGGQKTYGRVVPLATFPREEDRSRLSLSKWLLRTLREHYRQHHPEDPLPGKFWELEKLTDELLPLLPALTSGGRAETVEDSNGTLHARLSYDAAAVFAHIDSHGCALLNPPLREVEAPPFPTFAELAGPPVDNARRTPAEIWHQLGLIDDRRHPTRRGVIFSFFNHGEGLAVAAALEDKNYPIEELLFDIANLRAGHRFSELDGISSRLGSLCRMSYRGISAEGYLMQGVPPQYGDGAAEVLRILQDRPERKNEFISEQLGSGDIERAALEWRSLLNHIAFAPSYDWARWEALKDLARTYIASHFHERRTLDVPELLPAQQQRFHCRVHF